MTMNLAKRLVRKVLEGKDPTKVVEAQVFQPNPVDAAASGPEEPPGEMTNMGATTNVIILVKPGELTKAMNLIQAQNIRVKSINRKYGALGFLYNSARDSAAAILSAEGVAVKRVT